MANDFIRITDNLVNSTGGKIKIGFDALCTSMKPGDLRPYGGIVITGRAAHVSFKDEKKMGGTAPSFRDGGIICSGLRSGVQEFVASFVSAHTS